MATTTIDGTQWQVDEDGVVTSRVGRGEWLRPSRSELLAHDAQGPVWTWLRAQGVRRPSPSGSRGRDVSDAERQASGKRKLVAWLSEEESEALEKRRKGRSVRDTIGALILGRE